MSGPKKSSWQIRQEFIAARRREREANRNRQIKEIFNELFVCENRIKDMEILYGEHAGFINTRVNEWIKDVKNNCNYDLRDAWKGLKGIKNFLNKQEVNLKEKAERAKKIKDRQKEIENLKLEKKRIEEEKRKLKEEKINRAIASLISIKENYPEIVNNGVEQRIEIFVKALNINPDNKQTKKQILVFREQLKKKIDEIEEQKENLDYIAKTFSEALGGDNSEDSSGNRIIKGSIEGVAITVQIDKNTNDINFDTPTDGSCRKGLDALINKLENADIDLGPITVFNTGEKINNKQTLYNKDKLNA